MRDHIKDILRVAVVQLDCVLGKLEANHANGVSGLNFWGRTV